MTGWLAWAYAGTVALTGKQWAAIIVGFILAGAILVKVTDWDAFGLVSYVDEKFDDATDAVKAGIGIGLLLIGVLVFMKIRRGS